MGTSPRRCGFTLVELLVIIGVIGILLALLIPATCTSREAGRRATCVNNMKHAGLALQNFESNRRFYPASAEYDAAGQAIPGRWGHSWLTLLLPYLNSDNTLYHSMKLLANPDPTVLTLASGEPAPGQYTRMPMFLCPSYSGKQFRSETTAPGVKPPHGPITNYKALDATQQSSLAVAVGGPLPYGTVGDHPDGAIFPGTKTKLGDLKDGTSFTVVACETVEEVFAVWCEGRYASLAGLPDAVTMDTSKRLDAYYYPTGYRPGMFDEDADYGGKVSYLDYQFQDALPTATAGRYDATARVGNPNYVYGPSSRHPGAVNHAFADGHVQSVSTKADMALYMFVITRAGGDPGAEFCTRY
jgi:prepilin-type processing-associated H-X9-DG protein